MGGIWGGRKNATHVPDKKEGTCPKCGGDVIFKPDAMIGPDFDVWWSFKCCGCGLTFQEEKEFTGA